jgi:hypothetical protein
VAAFQLKPSLVLPSFDFLRIRHLFLVSPKTIIAFQWLEIGRLLYYLFFSCRYFLNQLLKYIRSVVQLCRNGNRSLLYKTVCVLFSILSGEEKIARAWEDDLMQHSDLDGGLALLL